MRAWSTSAARCCRPGTRRAICPKRADYDAAHIPGAVFVDWTRDIVDPDDPGPGAGRAAATRSRRRWASSASATTRSSSPTTTTTTSSPGASRGRSATTATTPCASSTAAGRAGSPRGARRSADRRPAPARGIHGAAPPGLRRTADEVARAARPTRDVLLIDARPPEQYAGSVSAAARGGHIPGARNVPYARLVDASTGRFLPPAELARVFATRASTSAASRARSSSTATAESPAPCR